MDDWQRAVNGCFRIELSPRHVLVVTVRVQLDRLKDTGDVPTLFSQCGGVEGNLQTEAADAVLPKCNPWELSGIYDWFHLDCSQIWNILWYSKFKVSEGKISHRLLFSWWWVLWRPPPEMPDVYLPPTTLAVPQGLTGLVSALAPLSPYISSPLSCSLSFPSDIMMPAAWTASELVIGVDKFTVRESGGRNIAAAAVSTCGHAKSHSVFLRLFVLSHLFSALSLQLHVSSSAGRFKTDKEMWTDSPVLSLWCCTSHKFLDVKGQNRDWYWQLMS